MSKRNLGLMIVLGATVGAMVASTAYADRARILVEGTGDAGVILGPNGSNGTFYTDDAYNMFYNPAYVNDYKNWAIIEKSNFSAQNNNAITQGESAGAALSTTNGATAEGGFVTSLGNFNLGIYLNRQDALWDAIYLGNTAGGTATNAVTTTQASMRPIDVLFGGDAGFMKWGIGATYSSYSTPNLANGTPNSNKLSTDLVVRGGLEWNDLDPFISWRAIGTDYGSSLSPKNSGLTAGLRYHWGDWTPFAAFRHDSYNGNTDYNAYGVGLGRTMKVTDSVKMGYSIAWFRQSTPCTGGTSCTGAITQSATYAVSASPNLNNGSSTYGDRTVVPLNMSVEADANTWLTLRAGLGYNFMDQVAGQTVADNTFGRLGATAHMGKADFDMAVGHGTAGTESSSDTNSQDFDIANGFFTAAALAYHW